MSVSLSEVARDRGVRTLVQGLISPTSSISSRTSESEGANADAGTPDIATESSVAGAPVSGNRKTYQHSPVQVHSFIMLIRVSSKNNKPNAFVVVFAAHRF